MKKKLSIVLAVLCTSAFLWAARYDVTVIDWWPVPAESIDTGWVQHYPDTYLYGQGECGDGKILTVGVHVWINCSDLGRAWADVPRTDVCFDGYGVTYVCGIYGHTYFNLYHPAQGTLESAESDIGRYCQSILDFDDGEVEWLCG